MSGECNIVTSEHCSVRVSVDATLHCIAPAPIQPPVSHRHKGILCLKVCLISHIRYTGSLPNVARPTKLLCLALLKHSKMLPCGEGTSKGKHSVITDGGGEPHAVWQSWHSAKSKRPTRMSRVTKHIPTSCTATHTSSTVLFVASSCGFCLLFAFCWSCHCLHAQAYRAERQTTITQQLLMSNLATCCPKVLVSHTHISQQAHLHIT